MHWEDRPVKTAVKELVQALGSVDPSARIAVRLWDGDVITHGDGPAQVTLVIRTEDAMRRCLGDGFLGFGESYMAGDIEIEGDAILLFKLGHLADFGNMALSWKEKLRYALIYVLHRNTLGRSRKNISHHYDMGNDFFELFLDESYTYTCAYFRSPDETLEQAQANKHEHVCRKVMLKPGEHIADLGCGWGAMLIYAAEHYGITGVGVTLSKAQVELGNARIAERGLQDRIRIELKDYRQLEGTAAYDKVVSVGLLEHVGKAFIPTCINHIARLLKPGGLGIVHSVANDTPFPDDPWTMRYIFPGTHIPPLSRIIEQISAHRMSVLDVENLRQHYTLTLQHWLDRYQRNIDTVRDRFGDSFARAWHLYLIVSLTSFEYGGNRLFQTVFSKGLNNDLPLTREHLYR